MSTEYIDPDKKPTLAQQNRRQTGRHDRLRLQGPHRARHRRRRAGPDQRHHQGGRRDSSGRSTSRRATARETPTSSERDGYNAHRRPRSAARTTPSRSSSSPSRARCPTTRRWWSWRDRRPTSSRPKIDALKKYLDKQRQAAPRARPARQAGQPAAHQPDRARPRLGHRRRQRRRRRRQRHGPADRHRRIGPGRGPDLSGASDHRALQHADGVPARARASPVSGGVDGHTRADLRRNRPAQLGRDRHQVAA